MEGKSSHLVLYISCVFSIWTATSFLCHFCGNTFLRLRLNALLNSSGFVNQWSTDFYVASMLTITQLGLCFVLVEIKSKEPPILTVVAITSHALATWATNISMAMTYASSTFAVKLLEPITSAVVQYITMGVPVSPVTAVSLPLIIGGAIIFTGSPFDTAANRWGLGAAFVSNILLAFRNIYFKKIQSAEMSENILCMKYSRTHQKTIGVLLVLSCIISASLVFEGILQASVLAYLSAVFHVAYSYASMGLALQKLTVITHAVTNISKRVLVVLLLYLVGRRQPSTSHLVGLAVCTVGLLVYVWGKHRKKNTTHEDERVGNTTGRSCLDFLSCMGVSFTLGMVLATALASYKQLPISTHLAVSPLQSVETINNFTHRSFSHVGLTRPSREMLLPDMKLFEEKDKKKVSHFLNLNLVKNPHVANSLMKKLSNSKDIIREAQRIQYNVFGNILKKYKYVMWIDIAAFENKGDSCITTGEAYTFKRLGLEVIFFCHFQACTPKKLDEAKAMAKNYSPDELVIIGRGGGNLIGYFPHNKIKFGLIDRFPNYKIVIFPQGIWVPHDDFNTVKVKQCIAKYCCSPNLTIVLREKPSYDLARKIFNGTTKLLLVPDSAFQFGSIPRFMTPVFDILWLKRDDNEGTPNFTLPRHPPHLRVHMSQWWRWKTADARTEIEKAYYLCTNGFMYLQRARVVITDRLHGHIVCLLHNIPHVLIDPRGRKLTNFHYTWTKSLNNVAVAKGPEDAMRMAIRMLERFKDSLPPRMPFLHLREGTKQEKIADANPQNLP